MGSSNRPLHTSPITSSIATMPAMKAMKTGGAMTQTGVFQSVAETTGLKTKEVKGVVDTYMGVAVEQVKKSGSFKFAGMLNMKLKNAGHGGAQRRQPLHQGAVRLQGEACLEDSEVLRDEEAQGDALNQQGVRVLSLLKVGNGHQRCLADSSCGGRPHRALL